MKTLKPTFLIIAILLSTVSYHITHAEEILDGGSGNLLVDTTGITEVPQDSVSTSTSQSLSQDSVSNGSVDESLGSEGVTSVSTTDQESPSLEPASSPEPELKTVSLHVRDGDTIVFDGDITVQGGGVVQVLDNNNISHSIATDSVLAVLEQADSLSDAFRVSDLAYYDSFDSFLLNCVEVGQDTPLNRCYNWQFVVNDQYPGIGMNAYSAQDGDDVYVYFGNPRRVVIENDTVIAHGIFYVKAQKYNYTDDSWSGISDTVVGIVIPDPNNPWNMQELATTTTSSDGRALLTAPQSGTYAVGITSDYYFPSIPLSVQDADGRISVLLRVRNSDELYIDKVFTLYSDQDVSIADNHDNNLLVKSQSVLNLLHVADEESSDFDLSDIQYFSDFNSFLINCVRLQAGSDPLCYNWQYVVNNTYPFVATNAYDLESNDRVYLYFGNQKRLILPEKQRVNSAFDIKAEKYNYEHNTWVPLSGVTLGVTIPNPNDPYNPTEIATSTVSSQGVGTFVLSSIGTYYAGIKDDYYYPLYPIIITEGSVTGGGGTSNDAHKTPSIDKMMAFLDSKQQRDGSFGSDLYSDWAALAYASVSGHSSNKNHLKEFLRYDSLGKSPSLTDFERRAMALMSLGINPYTGTDTNYIAEIMRQFDGVQFGDRGLYNDDIFALIVLLSAGYSNTDLEVERAASFIMDSILDANGFESLDIAAATIQAMNPLPTNQKKTAVMSIAISYILDHQNTDGGFGTYGNISNNFSTSWVLGALKYLGLGASSLTSPHNNPLDYLSGIQSDDGGIEDGETVDDNSRVWATSYAVLGAQEKGWSNVLKSFSKNEINVDSSDDTPTDSPITDVSTTTPNILNIPNDIMVHNVASDEPVSISQRSIGESDNQGPLSETKTPVPINNMAFAGGTKSLWEIILGSIAILFGGSILIIKWIRK